MGVLLLTSAPGGPPVNHPCDGKMTLPYKRKRPEIPGSGGFMLFGMGEKFTLELNGVHFYIVRQWVEK